MVPATTSHQPRASFSRSRLPRTASQKASVAPPGSRSATAAKLIVRRTLRFSTSIFEMSKPAAARSLSSNRCASSSRFNGSSAMPAMLAAIAHGSTPSLRRLRSARLAALRPPDP